VLGGSPALVNSKLPVRSAGWSPLAAAALFYWDGNRGLLRSLPDRWALDFTPIKLTLYANKAAPLSVNIMKVRGAMTSRAR
jgi:hypothetical protein